MSNAWQFKPGNPEYEKYIHSSHWRHIADKRLEVDGHICCVCGDKATDVHHLTYDRFGNEATDDLVSLCRKCHDQAENFYDPAVTPWAMDEIKPTGNNFMDLWAEFRLLDMGARLGRFISHYRLDYFQPDKRNGQVIFSYKPLPGAEQRIYDKISDITISMSGFFALAKSRCR